MSTNPHSQPSSGGTSGAAAGGGAPPPGQANVVQNLIQNPAATYGTNFQPHFLDQYKAYVEMADRISARRMLANTFFLTANTALIAALAAPLKDYFANPSIWLVAPFAALIIMCYTWKRIIFSYRQLNSGKYEVIGEMERHLPAAPYAYEWKVLGEGKDPKKYLPLTHVEDFVPVAFIVIYSFAILLLSRGLLSDLWSCVSAHLR